MLFQNDTARGREAVGELFGQQSLFKKAIQLALDPPGLYVSQDLPVVPNREYIVGEFFVNPGQMIASHP